MLITPSRRGFITGLMSLVVAAPAIVRAHSLMPVRAFDDRFEAYTYVFEGLSPWPHAAGAKKVNGVWRLVSASNALAGPMPDFMRPPPRSNYPHQQ
jgi:hypothetical protein